MFDITRIFSVFPLVLALAHTHPFEEGCHSEQNSNDRVESTVGSTTAWPVTPLTKTRKFHLQLSLSGPAPTPRGDGVRPSQESFELCSPCLPFLQHGHPLQPHPGFKMCLSIRDPSRTAQYLSALDLFEEIHQVSYSLFLQT